MKSISGKALCGVLRLHGWTLCRDNGSHHIFTKTGTDARISVPVHGSRPLKRGLLKRLIALAQLSEEDL